MIEAARNETYSTTVPSENNLVGKVHHSLIDMIVKL